MEDTKDELEEDYIEKKEPVEEPPEIKEEYKKIDDVEEKIEEGIKGEEQLEKKEEVKVEETHDEEAKEILEKSTKGFFGKIKDKFAKKEEVKEPQEEPKEEEIKKVEEPQEKKGVGGWLSEKVTKSVISEEKFDNLFWDMEVVLLENNVAVEVIEKIKGDLKENIVGKPIQRGKIGDTVTKSLQSSINELFDVEQLDIIERVKQKKPLVIVFAGINGSGKTTTIAKLTQLLLDNGLKCVLAASDTFRAASIEQLQKHADALNVKMIKHDYGADPAAVGFDAVKYAEAKGLDVVLIDTAGRLHSNTNLMQEMEKVIRVVKPDLKIFIGESITGNDCVEQARKFDEAIGLDGIILSKADVDEKGGAAISVSYVTKKPILYIGTGQTYADLKPFNPSIITESLGLSA
ncbi:MAG: signal recognition particle-docking protein FtsY [bacterium]|nr:signal recognition particle-docking protein FtsY [bacterium]